MREKEFLPLVERKMGISELNPMQKRMLETASEKRDIILLSPTGSGKTLAFVLPMLKLLKPASQRIQSVVIAPTRELVLQIAGVIKTLATGYKVTALYGGHKVEDEVNSLSITPDIIVATPGRLCDHLNRRNTDIITAGILVLDEFDKTLELGFEKEMKRIMQRLKNLNRIILTSATDIDCFPYFIDMRDAIRLSFLNENKELKRRINVYEVISDGKDKLDSLLLLLNNINSDKLSRTIVFVNHRESAERVYDFLKKHGVSTVLYHGALDQTEREKALTVFNNGSFPVLVCTDLASRGLDIADVASVIHYHQPLSEETYLHRNGRTARVDAEGDVYLLIGPDEELKPFVDAKMIYRTVPDKKGSLKSDISTIYFGAGKKEKLSKGDIAGFMIKEGGFSPEQIGKIDVFDHYALCALSGTILNNDIKALSSKKIKGTKRKIELVK